MSAKRTEGTLNPSSTGWHELTISCSSQRCSRRLVKGLKLPDEGLMLCPPDSYRGEWMLREIMAGGNFGHYAEREKHAVIRRVMEGRLRHLKLMRFDFWEEFWVEVNFCKAVITTLPTRIRYRTLSLRDIPR